MLSCKIFVTGVPQLVELCLVELYRVVTGVPRLVELCRDPVQRNFSDAVLVACLVIACFSLLLLINTVL